MPNWFQRTWEKTKEVVKDLGEGAKKVIGYVAEKISDWANGSKKANDDYVNNISKEGPYRPGNADSVTNYAQKASDFMSDMGPRADGLERQCIKEFFKYYFDLFQYIDNEDRIVIKNNFREYMAALQGSIKNYINDHISPSSPDFRRLVSNKETSRSEIEQYQRTVMDNALADFCVKIREKIQTLNQRIKDHFRQKQADQETIAAAALRDYSDLIISSTTGEHKKNKDKIVHISSTIIRCDYILSRL